MRVWSINSQHAERGLIRPLLLNLLLCAAWGLGCRPSANVDSALPAGGERVQSAPNSSTAAAARPPFEFVSIPLQPAEAGTYRNLDEEQQYAILESLGGGIASCDYDRDGDLDLFAPGGGGLRQDRQIVGFPATLLRHQAGPRFVDVSAFAGPFPSQVCTHGAIPGDFDADGFIDVLVTGYGRLVLWRNQGDGTWLPAGDEVGLANNSWATSSAWGDFDGDHQLDVFVANYTNWSPQNDPLCPRAGSDGGREVCPPKQFQPLDDQVFLGAALGRFEPAEQRMPLKPGGKGLGVLAADFDQDGWIDVYVANDTDENFYYANREGRLVEEGLLSGTAGDDHGNMTGSMGIAVVDFDRDLKTDILVANFEEEWLALYRGLGPHEYLYSSTQSGLGAIGRLMVSWGIAAVDFDLDGDQDLTIANGHVNQHPVNAPRMQLPLVLSNEGGRRLVRWPVPEGSYFDTPAMGRGLLSPDLDHDGRPDLVFSHINAPPAVLLNRLATNGRGFTVRLVGRIGPRDAEGAVVRLESKAGTQLRLVTSGGSYLSGGEPSVHFGLAEGDEPLRLRIQWPGGRQQTVELAGMVSPLFSADGGDRARVATADSQPDGEAQSPVAIVVVPHHLLVREPTVP